MTATCSSRLAAASAPESESSATARDLAALGAAVGVPGDGIVERETELIGQRRQPGQDVGQLMELLSLGSFAGGLRELAEFLRQPGHCGWNAPLGVTLPVDLRHELLEAVEFHAGGC